VAIFDEKGRTLMLGIAVGAAAAILGREFFAPLRRLGRPLAKAALDSGMTAFERGQHSAALMGEHLSDLVAEVVAQRRQRAPK
jgi:hypothetical protein